MYPGRVVYSESPWSLPWSWMEDDKSCLSSLSSRSTSEERGRPFASSCRFRRPSACLSSSFVFCPCRYALHVLNSASLSSYNFAAGSEGDDRR